MLIKEQIRTRRFVAEVPPAVELHTVLVLRDGWRTAPIFFELSFCFVAPNLPLSLHFCSVFVCAFNIANSPSGLEKMPRHDLG